MSDIHILRNNAVKQCLNLLFKDIKSSFSDCPNIHILVSFLSKGDLNAVEYDFLYREILLINKLSILVFNDML